MQKTTYKTKVIEIRTLLENMKGLYKLIIFILINDIK